MIRKQGVHMQIGHIRGYLRNSKPRTALWVVLHGVMASAFLQMNLKNCTFTPLVAREEALL